MTGRASSAAVGLLLAGAVVAPLAACSAVDDGARVRDDAPHAETSPGPGEAPGRDPRRH